MPDKRKEILESCEKILDGVEEEKLNGNSLVLLCKKIARLSNDDEAMIWLSYETGGYPRTKDGHIVSEAWEIGASHGRKYVFNEKNLIFTELIDEIETGINSCLKAINNFSTSGASFDGNYSLSTSKSFTTNVHNSTVEFVKSCEQWSKKRSILISEYYNYALKKKIEIEFGNISLNLFENYQARVDKYISGLNKDIHEKLKAITFAMERDEVESYSQALTSCRKVFNLVSNDLFDKVLPNYKLKTFKTRANKEIDITGDHTKNKLSAVIETMTQKSDKNTIVGSSVLYLIDLLESISDSQSKGVHNDVDKETAEECVIQTYIALGNILELLNRYQTSTDKQ